ncbi:MAG: hypothetical protein J5732_09090 [Bacteroidaceae bacterium]|nr:hypothetical protein [Bacteroidaceae bacterium]
MRNKGDKYSFWPSYVDIVTTLFAIMVVLFAVSYSRFRVKEAELRKIADKYEEIKKIYQTVENIDSTYFAYDSTHVKHIFKIQVTYQKGEFDLYKLMPDRTNRAEADTVRERIKAAGNEIKRTVENLQKMLEKPDNKPDIKQDIKYLVVIEGQASADGYNTDEYHNNDVLSYQRALELHKFWQRNNIDFTSMPKCELVISGSGEGGVPRDKYNEVYNQRFLIHIVPVIGNIRLNGD